jgi:PAS domain S-box-containing protein
MDAIISRVALVDDDVAAGRGLRAVVEHTSDLVALAAADGVVAHLNPAGRGLLGTDGRATGAAAPTLEALVAEDDRDRFTGQVQPAARAAGSWSGPLRLVDVAGTTVPVTATVGWHDGTWTLVARDAREGRGGAELLREERERYRSLVAQAPLGIWVADRTGRTTFVNEQVATVVGRGTGDLVGSGWTALLHPDDRAATTAAWAAAVRDGREWAGEYRVVTDDGVVRTVTSTARPLHDGAGAVTGYLGTTVDLTARRRAEDAARSAASRDAARDAADVAAARLRATVDGLAAIVWEAVPAPDGDLRFTFVSDRAEELLGHPVRRWLDKPGFWAGLLHPDDRGPVLRTSAERTAAGADHDLTHRVLAADGRTVWLHHVVHVEPGCDGRPTRLRGVAVDVTEQRRAERSAALLAEAGRILAEPAGAAAGEATTDGTAEGRLIRLMRLLAGELGDGAVVSLVGPDGRARRLAVAHDDPDVERTLLALAPTTLPPPLLELLAARRPVLVPVTEELSRAASQDAPDARRRMDVGAREVLVVPLHVGDELVGMLGFLQSGTRPAPGPAELDLAAELGRRAAAMIEDERRRVRDRYLQAVSADLAAADGAADAARRLVDRLTAVLGAGAMTVFLLDPERNVLRIVHGAGYEGALLADFATIRLDEDVPLAVAARTGEPVWLRDRAEWVREFPALAPLAVGGERHAAAALPLRSGATVVGVIGMSFGTPRTFAAGEREFVARLVAQAAPALERAATADERRRIADTLQRSLLPAALPALPGLAVAARYLPGARGAQTGGDWYDVVPLAHGRVALVVGDVVGRGAGAAAVMGQLRSALSAYLLEGHGPLRAVELLDVFAARLPAAVGSTVACLVLDPASGGLEWARAGHPDPLVTGPGGARFLDGASGTVLGVRGRPPFRRGTGRLVAGDSVVLYTDGLVERRTEVVDVGLERLRAAGAAAHDHRPGALADRLLDHEPPGGSSDDVALLVVRLLPAPLELAFPADGRELRGVRRRTAAWAGPAGIDQDTLYDLQLCAGEAAANAVEHAYPAGAPGPVRLRLAVRPDGGIAVRVADDGRWRPPDVDPGHRGRGLMVIERLGREVRVERGPGGTVAEFVVPPPAVEGGPVGPGAPAGRPPAATGLRVAAGPDVVRVEVLGDLDLAGVDAVRTELLDRCGGTGPPVHVDLRATAFLTSAGASLLLDAAAAAAGRGFRVLVRAGSGVRRVLVLRGVAEALRLTES